VCDCRLFVDDGCESLLLLQSRRLRQSFLSSAQVDGRATADDDEESV
jgi:hypothetical protein